MTTLTMRPYAGESDLQPIVDLLDACDQVDRFEEWQSVDDLRLEMDEPGFDKTRDVRLWEDGEGHLAAAGFVYVPEEAEDLDGFLWFKVHPSARGGELEREIVAWGERRMREIGRERGKAPKLRSGTRTEDT